MQSVSHQCLFNSATIPHVTSMSCMYSKIAKPSLKIKQTGDENKFQLALLVSSGEEARASLADKKYRLQSLINR